MMTGCGFRPLGAVSKNFVFLFRIGLFNFFVSQAFHGEFLTKQYFVRPLSVWKLWAHLSKQLNPGYRKAFGLKVIRLEA